MKIKYKQKSRISSIIKLLLIQMSKIQQEQNTYNSNKIIKKN
jgi:hypothetical protein